MVPDKDTSHETKAQMVAAMDVAMGGRAAEEIILGKEGVTGIQLFTQITLLKITLIKITSKNYPIKKLP
jgi:ATP-dependent Zn protease